MKPDDLTSKFSKIAKNIYSDAILLRHWPLEGGVSAFVDALEIKHSNTEIQQFVIRRQKNNVLKQHADNIAATEFKLHKVLYNAGFPVPKVLLLDSSKSILPSPYFVMELIEGKSEIQNEALKNQSLIDNNLDAVLAQMAHFLVRLHSFNIQEHDLPCLPAGEDPVKGALTYIPNISEWSALRSRLSLKKASRVNEVLLHGDFWPGNILWNNQKLAAVIDWEDSSIGNIAADLACSRLEIMSMYGEAAMHAFTENYLAESARNVLDLPLWEVYSGFAALASMADWGLDEDAEAARRESTTQFVKRAATEIL